MTKFWLQRLQGKLLVMSRKALAPLEREAPVITVSQFTTRRRRTSFEMMSVWSARQGSEKNWALADIIEGNLKPALSSTSPSVIKYVSLFGKTSELGFLLLCI